MTIKTNSRKQQHQSRRESKANELAPQGMELWGRIVTWRPGDGKATHATVVASLATAGLDPAVAKELQPRHAFTRVINKMKADGVIDLLTKDSADHTTFQFTTRFMEQNRWKYVEKTTMQLDMVSGKILCGDSDVREKAQKLLDEAIATRTSNDITKIVQDLFEQHADLISLRDHGGVYFVPAEYEDFVGKVRGFLGSIGGRLDGFPIPKGDPQGDRGIQDAVVGTINALVAEHQQKITSFDVNTRSDTLEHRAKAIRDSRVKVEAYAHFLGSMQQDMLDSVAQAQADLENKISAIHKMREVGIANGTVVGRVVNRGTIFTYSVTSVIRWMGKERWTFEQCRAVLNQYGCEDVADATLRAQLLAGRKGERGEPAALKSNEAKELENAKS